MINSLIATINSRDPLGRALRLHWQGQTKGITSDYTIDVIARELEHDVLKVAHFFRDWSEMPELEQKALEACRGSVLDVGAAAGSHALWLQQQGVKKPELQVRAIDISSGAVEVMQARGVMAERADFFQYQRLGQGFDTILLLMNGLGIARTLDLLPLFFYQLSQLLAPGGQVLLDSSDLKEYAEDFAEVKYQMYFQGHKTKWFDWLFLPFATLSTYAQGSGFNATLLHQEEAGAYLARLQKTAP